MDGVLTFQGRLPGVLVETALPARRESPLRLDVAGFVGFAARGPLNTPVALEDFSGYRRVFGGDLPLALDPQAGNAAPSGASGGALVFAHLPSAVKAFFDNGGRRCYVVRVAGEGARANLLPLPGLAAVAESSEDGEESGDFVQALAAAAWAGRWSDGMSVHTQLRTLPLRIAAGPGPRYVYDAETRQATLRLELPTAATVSEGDVLRLGFAGGELEGAGIQALLVVASVQVTGSFSVRGFPVAVGLRNVTDKAAFAAVAAAPAATPSAVQRLGAAGWEEIAGALHPIVTKTGSDAGHHLFLGPGVTVAPVTPGSLLRVTYAGGEVLYFPVADVRAHYAPPADDGAAQAALAEQGDPLLPEGVYWRAVTDELLGQRAIGGGLGALRTAERLRFDLAIYAGETALETLPDLHFNPPAAYWGERQAQEALALGSSGGSGAGYEGATAAGGAAAPGRVVSDFWADRLARVKDDGRPVEPAAFGGRSLHLRAVGAEPPPAFTPGASALPAHLRPPVQAPAVWLPLAMRALPTAAGVVADLGLPGSPPASGKPPRFQEAMGKNGLDVFDPQALFLDPRLKDATVHGLMGMAEAILYLQQPPGVLMKLHGLLGIEEIGLIALPDAGHRPWQPAPALPAPPPVVEPPPPEPPWQEFVRCETPEETKTPPHDPQAPNCTDSPLKLLPVIPGGASEDPCAPGVPLPELLPPGAYDVEPLLAVQRALVTLCAARADVLGVLNAPAHFGCSELLDWQARLVNTPALQGSPALSYAAAYHPWVLVREETCGALAPVRAVPPDGVACGLIAGRERARGVWIAPANAPLAGVLGLSPSLSDADWEALYNRQVNLLRPQPGRFGARFLALSACTLSADRLLLPISVRRLLIFLRKLALRRGQQYVFESNDERFRRQVQVSFERLLAALVERGALAAFEVVTSEEVNTPHDAYNGRFLVALKVAPTLPIEFITVVMLRTGESLLEVLER